MGAYAFVRWYVTPRRYFDRGQFGRYSCDMEFRLVTSYGTDPYDRPTLAEMASIRR